jgi:hypothetical protein
VDIELLKAQVKNQSSHVAAEVESLYLCPEVATARPTFTAFLRMATIGTALGARLRLGSLRYYADCQFGWMMDPCERNLEELGLKWNLERYYDAMQQYQMPPNLHQYHQTFPQQQQFFSQGQSFQQQLQQQQHDQDKEQQLGHGQQLQNQYQQQGSVQDENAQTEESARLQEPEHQS